MVAPPKGIAGLFEGMASGKAKAGGKKRVPEGMASGNATSSTFGKKATPPIPRAKPSFAKGGPKLSSGAGKPKVKPPAGLSIGSFSDKQRYAEAKRRGTRTYDK